MSQYSNLSKNSQSGHVLIVEQSPHSIRSARRVLEAHRFRTTVFRPGQQSNGLAQYDLVLLEHQHCSHDRGIRILERLREVSSVPIVMVSDEGRSSTRIEALESGADDFFGQPYIGRELVARIKATLRRARLSQPSDARVLKIDSDSKQVKVRGKSVDLTHREFEILSVLAADPGKNFSRSEILSRVWGPGYNGEPRRVDLYISRIRAKMHIPETEDLIRSIYGVGYRLEVCPA